MATPRAAHSTARRGALAKLRAYFLPRVLDSFKVVSAFQAACGVKDGVATNRLLHAIFTFGAALGNEITFILFLPYLFWEYDIVVARRLIILWGALYYIGQSLKDMCVAASNGACSVCPLCFLPCGPAFALLAVLTFGVAVAGCSCRGRGPQRCSWRRTTRRSTACHPHTP